MIRRRCKFIVYYHVFFFSFEFIRIVVSHDCLHATHLAKPAEATKVDCKAAAEFDSSIALHLRMHGAKMYGSKQVP